MNNDPKLAQPEGQRAVIVFAHGSRDPLWRAPVEAVAARVRELAPEIGVACAYLEMSEPDLVSAAGRLIDAGAREVSILPLFIGVGMHARRDLPALVQQLRSAHPQVRFEVRPAVGEDAGMVEAMARLATG